MDELGKMMSCILRRRPIAVGLRPDREGFVAIDELTASVVRHPGWSWVALSEVRLVAGQDPKGRYDLEEGRIRATFKRVFDPKATLPQVEPPGDLYLGCDRADVGIDLVAASDRRLRLESTPEAAARAAVARFADPIVLIVDGTALGPVLRGDESPFLVDRIGADATRPLVGSDELVAAARRLAALEGALHCPDESTRLRHALRLHATADRDGVERDLIAALDNDQPAIRYHALCALGAAGRAAVAKMTGAVHRSALAGVRMSPRVFEGIVAAFESENAPWVAEEMLKAIGEQSFTGELAPHRDRAIAFLREAAGSMFTEVRDEAVNALAALGAE